MIDFPQKMQCQQTKNKNQNNIFVNKFPSKNLVNQIEQHKHNSEIPEDNYEIVQRLIPAKKLYCIQSNQEK